MKKTSHSNYNSISGRDHGRIEALSDGVFAIALTLLILDVHVPLRETIHSEGDLIRAFCALSPKLLSVFLSFMTLGIFWGGHSAQFQFIQKSDRHLHWINLFFLLFVSLLPFSTAFLSEYLSYPFAVGLYWLNIFILGLLLYVHWAYAYSHDFVVASSEVLAGANHAIRRRIIIAQSLYAFGAALCFVDTMLSIAVIIIVQLNYAFGLVWTKTRKTS